AQGQEEDGRREEGREGLIWGESREQRAENREQRSESRDQKAETSAEIREQQRGRVSDSRFQISDFKSQISAEASRRPAVRGSETQQEQPRGSSRFDRIVEPQAARGS